METSFLDPVLNPLLKLNPILAIIIISVSLSAIITILYKYLTDQNLMKSLREQSKAYQKEMKEHKNNPEKMMEIQKKSMEVTMKMMKQSFKPMLFTMIPILLIFGWLNAHLAYEPIMPGQEFTTTVEFAKDITGSATIVVPENIEIIDDEQQQIKTIEEEGWIWDTEKSIARWKLKSDNEGEYLLEFKYDNKTYKKDVLVTNERNYAKITEPVNNNHVKTINIDNGKMRPLSFIGLKLGWIWTYIIFSVLTNLALKKTLKIH